MAPSIVVRMKCDNPCIIFAQCQDLANPAYILAIYNMNAITAKRAGSP
jgi:hypothetical protein